jgi:cytochrome P450
LPAQTDADFVGLHKRNGPLFWWRFLGARSILVGTHEAVRQLLNAEGTLVRASYPPSTRQLLGRHSMINIHDKQHLRIKWVLLFWFLFVCCC